MHLFCLGSVGLEMALDTALATGLETALDTALDTGLDTALATKTVTPKQWGRNQLHGRGGAYHIQHLQYKIVKA